jgi:hypothetical protein
VFNTRYEFICKEQEAALLQGITLAELQQFYAAHLAPSSVQRRKLTVQVIPNRHSKSSTAAQKAGEGAKQQEQQQPTAPHVQHEHGMVEPNSPRQAGRHVVGATVVHAGVSGAAEQQNGEANAAAVGSPSSRQLHAKRQRRQQEAVDAAAGGGDAAADASALLPAGVQLQLLADPVQFKQSRERHPVYCTVKPQLAQQQ